jgi:hypothetical protein
MRSADSKGCKICGGEQDLRQTQTLRGIGQETDRPTLGNPEQTGNTTMTSAQHVKEATGRNITLGHTPPYGDKTRPAYVLAQRVKKGLPK